MRQFSMRLTAVLLAAFASAACGPQPVTEAPAPEFADLVLRGGKVVTVDPALGTVEAIAVNGYRIAAVGDDAAIAARIGPHTEVIELRGRLALPGFIEGHGHFLALGRAQQILDLAGAESWNAIVEQVAVAVDGAEAGDWIFGRGWHQEKWLEPPQPNVEGAPLNDGLNAVAPDNPVYLGHASGHAAFANNAALAAAGIDGQTPDPAGGTIVRAANGRATGLLRENAQDLVEEAIAHHEARLGPEAFEAMQRQRVQLAG
ncbi:MAG: amidohydrolase family protein, partial [Gammaproteobacteria bacterium]|nr:amidohydrolase family protein [Gammaproteobacteria bacterium]